MTNFEKIKNMSIEEMAKDLLDFAVMRKTKVFCKRPCLQDGKERDCKQCMAEWLQSEAD